MKNNIVVRAFLLEGVMLFGLLAVSCERSNQRDLPPNIIIFLVDDMGLMDTSVPFMTDSSRNVVRYPQNKFYRTPHMEQLAKNGVRFSHFYAHSVCSPTRVSILTGQNSARHGVTTWINSEKNNRGDFGPTDWNWKGLNAQSVTLPRMLQQAGYRTIHVGKAHFGPFDSEGEDPRNLGFDINIAGSSIGEPGSYYGTDGFGHIRGRKSRAVQGLDEYHGKEIFLTQALTLEAKAAISKSKEEGKPFFLYMAHYALHTPFQSDPRYADNYKDSVKSEKAQAYATLIEGMDQSLGDLVQHVKDLRLGENTIIFFLGDNGSDAPLPIDNDYSSSAPLRGKKGKHWEGGMRVPFIASWVSPNSNISCQRETPIVSNTIQFQMGTIMDIFPTLCHLAQVPLPRKHLLDGFDLKIQLAGKQNEKHDGLFLNHFPHKHRSSYFTSFVKQDWKVVYHFFEKNHYELYHLKKDPFESNNLAEKNQEKLQMMLMALAEDLEAKNAFYPESEGVPIALLIPN